MSQKDLSTEINQIIAKCGTDKHFKQKLRADPAATLKAEGVILPDSVSVTVLENTDKRLHLVIPADPTELSDADLDQVSGGDSIDDGVEGG